MEKIRIAICDDEKKAVSIISASVKAIFAENKMDVIVEEFLSPVKFLEMLDVREYELVLLDICMPELDGVELGKKISKLGKHHSIIFISSRMDRMYDTFAVQPFGFVRKTNFMDDINEVVSRYIKQRNYRAESQRVRLKSQGGELINVNIDRLKYVECFKNIQELFFDGEGESKLYSRMNTLEEQLKEYGFIRTHKGYLVNCKYIQRLDSKELVLTTGEVLPVGRSRYHQAMDEYMSYVSAYGMILGE